MKRKILFKEGVPGAKGLHVSISNWFYELEKNSGEGPLFLRGVGERE